MEALTSVPRLYNEYEQPKQVFKVAKAHRLSQLHVSSI